MLECDLCHEPITGDYYEMPDGLTVCPECLEEWAAAYEKCGVADD